MARLPDRLPTDAAGQPLFVGDRVRFRGRAYTILHFHRGLGIAGTCSIEFVEPQAGHADEMACELTVDLIEDWYEQTPEADPSWASP